MNNELKPVPAKYLKTHHYAQRVYWERLSDSLQWNLLIESGIVDRKYEDIGIRGRTMFLECWNWECMNEHERCSVLDAWAEQIGRGHELSQLWPQTPSNKVEAVA